MYIFLSAVIANKKERISPENNILLNIVFVLFLNYPNNSLSVIRASKYYQNGYWDLLF